MDVLTRKCINHCFLTSKKAKYFLGIKVQEYKLKGINKNNKLKYTY